MAEKDSDAKSRVVWMVVGYGLSTIVSSVLGFVGILLAGTFHYIEHLSWISIVVIALIWVVSLALCFYLSMYFFAWVLAKALSGFFERLSKMSKKDWQDVKESALKDTTQSK